jgi:natural product precursor
MKKLGKLKLNNFSEMSEQEMKFVVGGQYDPNAKKACHETAPTCSGVCAPIVSYVNNKPTLISTKCTRSYDFATKQFMGCSCNLS